MTYDDNSNKQSAYSNSGVDGPPRMLLWGVVGLFVLVLIGFGAGIFAFNNVLTSGQQQRVVNIIPFMEGFLQTVPTPQGGVLPTVAADPNQSDDPMSLLDMPVGDATDPAPETVPSEMTAEATEPMTETVTEEAMITMPTSTPLPSATPLPSPTATFTPLPPTATPEQSAQQPQNQTRTQQQTQLVSQSPSNVSFPTQARMFGMTWARQTWNNCGPATITTALTYYGWQEDQDYAKDLLRPNREDKNVSPSELVDFVNEQTGVNAIARMGGNLNMLRALIASDIPVVVERGMMFEANDWLGHYQTLVAYDNNTGVFYAYDSFLGDGTNGEGEPQRFGDLDADWRAFNRTFIVIYTDDREDTVRRILGELWDEDRAAEIALQTALDEASENQQNGFAWHNAGTSLVELGRYREAARAYDRARQTSLPWRMLWYQFGMFEAYYEMGRYNDIISLTTSNLNQAAELEESLYWRGRAHLAIGNTNQAVSDFRTALRYNPNFDAAQAALDNL
jgi:hypothetical protein